MKASHKIILIGAAVVCILLLFVLLERSKGVEVSTDKNDYATGGELLVDVRNNFGAAVCFSSCYPYYLEEKKDDQWVPYEYGDCLKQDAVATCIPQNETKKFRITLSQADRGLHRIKIPA
jgi:hypothetical protein